jgi:hypothetical protein
MARERLTKIVSFGERAKESEGTKYMAYVGKWGESRHIIPGRCNNKYRRVFLPHLKNSKEASCGRSAYNSGEE